MNTESRKPIAPPPAPHAENDGLSPHMLAAVSDDASAELRGDPLWRDVRYIGGLVVRYLRADPWIGALALAAKIASSILVGYVGVQMQVWMAGIIDKLAGRDVQGAFLLLGFVAGLYGVQALQGLVDLLAELTLRIRWRAHFTGLLLGRWLSERRFHWLDREGKVDFPEQRIQEDLAAFGQLALDYLPGLFTTTTYIVLYAGTLWHLSPVLTVDVAGLVFAVPGTIFLLMLALSSCEIVLIHKVGNRTTRSELVRQRLDATFRDAMARVREHSEAVALERGAERERRKLGALYGQVRENWRHYTRARSGLAAVSMLPSMDIELVPLAVAIPLVLSGHLTIGGVTLLAAAYAGCKTGVMGIVLGYVRFANLRATANRIQRFEQALAEPVPSDIGLRPEPQAALRWTGLRLSHPDGRPMLDAGSLAILPGARLLVRGPSGSGKSSLLRALAGLWRHGAGSVARPERAGVMFLPQRSYLPDGTLKAALAYPADPDALDDAACRRVLAALSLPGPARDLHRHRRWSAMLSPGEQQRIAAARAILARPDFLFLDEATSALDPSSERQMYALLLAELPDTAIVSVAHRASVAHFHRELLDIAGGKTVRRALDPRYHHPDKEQHE